MNKNRLRAGNDEAVYYYIIRRCHRTVVVATYARASGRAGGRVGDEARHSSMIIFHIKVISGLDNK